MSIKTVEFPTIVDQTSGTASANTDLRAALPVLGGSQWEVYSQSANWLLAKGGTLITQGPSGGYITAGNSLTYRYYIWPRYQIVARLWCLSLEAGVFGLGSSGVLTINGTAFVNWTVDGSAAGRVSCLHYMQSVSSPTADPGEVTVEVSVDSAAATGAFMRGLACYEIRRAVNTTFGPTPGIFGAFHTLAPPPASLQTGAIISENFDQSLSVDGLMRIVMHAEGLQAEARRSCFFSDCRPAGQVFGTSYTSLFTRDPFILARPRYFGETSRSIAVAVYGSGPTGSGMQFTSAAGTYNLGLPTSNGWAVGTLSVDCEEPARWAINGGTPSGHDGRVTIEARRVGAGTCTVYSVCMGEAD